MNQYMTKSEEFAEIDFRRVNQCITKMRIKYVIVFGGGKIGRDELIILTECHIPGKKQQNSDV